MGPLAEFLHLLATDAEKRHAFWRAPREVLAFETKLTDEDRVAILSRSVEAVKMQLEREGTSGYNYHSWKEHGKFEPFDVGTNHNGWKYQASDSSKVGLLVIAVVGIVALSALAKRQ